MANFKLAEVIKICRERSGFSEIEVKLEDEVFSAVNYPDLTGGVAPGDKVIVSTSAVELDLGTGGRLFVLWNTCRREYEKVNKGHVMKLRYTPLQISCEPVEEQGSPHWSTMREAKELAGFPVIVGSLHSQLPAVAVTIKEVAPDAKIAYLMTDGGALPLPFSDLVADLAAGGWIDTTITVGHAFGGDLEAVNVFSGLIAAKAVANADVAIVMMGPGGVGTDTPYGFSGIEQGQVINAVGALWGLPIAIPRLSFKDSRSRHFGISHHTHTALGVVALSPAQVVLAKLPSEQMDLVLKELTESGITSKHQINVVDNPVTIDALRKRGPQVTTMGRTLTEEPEFFLTAGAAGLFAAEMMVGQRK